jgi:hypothetical protein
MEQVQIFFVLVSEALQPDIYTARRKTKREVRKEL